MISTRFGIRRSLLWEAMSRYKVQIYQRMGFWDRGNGFLRNGGKCTWDWTASTASETRVILVFNYVYRSRCWNSLLLLCMKNNSTFFLRSFWLAAINRGKVISDASLCNFSCSCMCFPISYWIVNKCNIELLLSSLCFRTIFSLGQPRRIDFITKYICIPQWRCLLGSHKSSKVRSQLQYVNKSTGTNFQWPSGFVWA